MSVLSKIVDDVRRRVKREKRSNPREEMEINYSKRSSLRRSIETHPGAPVIGELKQSSPTSGEIRGDFQPSELARSLERGGASGISVLTEPQHFGGKIEYLEKVKDSVDLPILRKDFIIDEYQLYQTAETEADAVLLISKILEDELPQFVDTASDLGLESLVEVSNVEEAKTAEAVGADMIGINNRDLNTLEVDLSRTERILKYLQGNPPVISESGIRCRRDVERVLRAGSDAVLVGTALMKSRNVRRKVERLVHGDDDG